MYRRLILGLVGFGLLATGVTIYIVEPTGQGLRVFGASCIRVGLAIIALWLAYRDLQRIPLWMLIAILVTVILVARFPRLILVAIPVIVAFWFLRPRPNRPKPTQP